MTFWEVGCDALCFLGLKPRPFRRFQKCCWSLLNQINFLWNCKPNCKNFLTPVNDWSHWNHSQEQFTELHFTCSVLQILCCYTFLPCNFFINKTLDLDPFCVNKGIPFAVSSSQAYSFKGCNSTSACYSELAKCLLTVKSCSGILTEQMSIDQVYVRREVLSE